MNKIVVLLILVSTCAFSQTNNFTGTWSNENAKDAVKDYILKITIAQSNNKIYGVAEVINNDNKLNTGVLEITGYEVLNSKKAHITLSGKNNISASAVLYTSENRLQFNKRLGSSLIPKEVILNKIYE